MSPFTLRRLDANPIDNSAPECRAVIVIRNEETRLPWLLSYYRSLGIARFFVIDNGSEDNSLEYVKQQKDCHVFVTDEPFALSEFGILWQMQIMNEYTGNHWWLITDADEMLVYPGSETMKLPELCRYLDSVGAEGLYTIMLDMYSSGPISEAVYKSPQSFLKACGYFDSEYQMCRRIKPPWAGVPFPLYEPIGGPRLRRFYPEFYTSGRLRIARVKALRRLRDILRRSGIKLGGDFAIPPTIFKVPLLKWKPHMRLINNHVVTPLKLAPVTGAILHFKFFSDFHERVVREAGRRQHFDNGSEYMRYLKILETDPRMSFFYSKTAEYTGTEQLVRLGLIKDDETLATYRITSAQQTNFVNVKNDVKAH